MASSSSIALRQRLLHDIAELQANPYPNIKYVPRDDDLHTGCLVLNPIAGVVLHLTVKFRDNYPLSPPRIRINSEVEHPNVFGGYICASILNTEEGYTPAYTLKGICIQMLSFFSSDSIEQTGGHYSVSLADYFYSESSSYVCEHCDFMPEVARPARRPRSAVVGYAPVEPDGARLSPSARRRRNAHASRNGTSTGGADAYRVMQLEATPAEFVTPGQPMRHMNRLPANYKLAEITDLPDELLVLICDKLQAEELAPFSRAWDRIGSEQGIISKFNIIRNRELICFCLKKDFNNAQLGVGVRIEQSGRLGKLESEFDLLSREAYEDHHIRKSVQGRSFEAWLPLPIAYRHYKSIEDIVETRLEFISRTARFPTFSPVEVIYAFMNDIVVRLSTYVEAEEDSFETYDSGSSLVHASEKAIESYYHLFHLLLCLATADPRRVHSANIMIKNFLNGKTSKQHVSNLGYLLVAALISDADMTVDLLMAIIRETVTRNVVWMLDRRGANMPELSYMEADSISAYRLQKTFDASKTSYRLLMFLNLFRQTINRGSKSLVQIRDELFDAHGAPPRGTAAKLANDIKALQQVKTFPDFIKIMGLKPPQASQFTGFLRNCVEDSMKKGYSVWGISQDRALTLRRQVDPDVQIRDNPKPEWKGRGTFHGGFFPGNGQGGKGRGGGGGSTRGRGIRRGY